MAGSYLFAETSGLLGKTLMKWGDRGKLMLPEIVGMRLATFLMIWIPVLIAVLVVIDRLAVR